MRKLLIANRGEIALRISLAASELGVRSVALFSEDDAGALHRLRADEAYPLRGVGPAAYLDTEQIAALATATGCDALHPGYGFLSESAAFAQRCEEAGVTFVGPRVETLAALGDKLAARTLARRCGVPLLPGSEGPIDASQARAFLASLGGEAMVLKAVAGGGGRGMRVVRHAGELEIALARCRSEARVAFGNDAIYAERLAPRARHVEVQVLGDGSGAVCALGERDCSLQRRHQKIVEVAPCPGLSESLRERLTADALRMAAAVRYRSAGTFEFLVWRDAGGKQAGPSTDPSPGYAFIEANARLQVEHTVTEEVLGLDLVRLQLELAAGRTLAEIGLRDTPVPRGFAIQVRLNAEEMGEDGVVRPAVGRLERFELPTGRGVRIDTAVCAGTKPNPSFDSLLAKIVCHSTSSRFSDAVTRARRALAELQIEGIATNLSLLRALLEHPDLVAGRVHTRFVEEEIASLRARCSGADDTAGPSGTPCEGRSVAGAVVDRTDPLAVLA